MDLLSRSKTNVFNLDVFVIRFDVNHNSDQLFNCVTRQHGNKYFTTMHQASALEYKTNRIFNHKTESCHIWIGNCNLSIFKLLSENGNHRSSTTHNITISSNREENSPPSGQVIRINYQLLGTKLGCTIQINWTNRFVRTDEHHTFNTFFNGCLN